MLELLRLRETHSSDSKHQRTSFQEKTDQEVVPEEAEELSEVEEGQEVAPRQVAREEEEVSSTLIPTLKNSPHYERWIVKSTFETNPERLK